MLNEGEIEASKQYWTSHNVTLHHQFSSVEDSFRFLEYRNRQYYDYNHLMPTDGFDGKVVVDFGCGPGHDLVGFGTGSKPNRLIGMDVSTSSLQQAGARLHLHGIKADLIEIDVQRQKIDLPDASVDVIHSSGVLHHMAHPEIVLQEFRRVLKDDGIFQAMVYNRQSIWYHLYVPFIIKIEQQRFLEADAADAFRMSTDGPDCPISRNYTREEFKRLAESCGFVLDRFAVAVSCIEMSHLPKRFAAIMNPDLPAEHRAFLTELTFDERGLPMHQGSYAGIDGCYRFSAARKPSGIHKLFRR